MKFYIGDGADFYHYMNSPYMREVIPCGCGVEIQRRNSDKHDQTQRHSEWEKHPHDFFNKQLDCKCGLKYTKSDEDVHKKSKEHKERLYCIKKEEAKVKCECGSTYNRYNKLDHLSTKKHQAFVNRSQ
jgi:hypothetical protein